MGINREVMAWIGLGANMDDPVGHLMKARQHMSEHLETVGVSSLYRSAPIECLTPQNDYLNAVIAVNTTLSAHKLLNFLLEIERSMGRTREGYHSPRTLDLDLLLYGSFSIHDEVLTVPHPFLQQRAFVLKPLYEVAPLWMLPDGKKIANLLEEVASQRIEKFASDHWSAQPWQGEPGKI